MPLLSDDTFLFVEVDTGFSNVQVSAARETIGQVFQYAQGLVMAHIDNLKGMGPMTQQPTGHATATTTRWATNSQLYATAPRLPGSEPNPPERCQYPSARRQVSFATDEEALVKVVARPVAEEDCGW